MNNPPARSDLHRSHYWPCLQQQQLEYSFSPFPPLFTPLLIEYIVLGPLCYVISVHQSLHESFLQVSELEYSQQEGTGAYRHVAQPLSPHVSFRFSAYFQFFFHLFLFFVLHQPDKPVNTFYMQDVPGRTNWMRTNCTSRRLESYYILSLL